MALSTAATQLEAATLSIPLHGEDAASAEPAEPAAESIDGSVPIVKTLTLTKDNSWLADRTFSERVDSDVLNRVLQTDLVDAEDESAEAKWMRSKYFCNEREHLVKLQRKLKGDVLLVKHKKGKIGFGRVVPTGFLAAIGLRAELRWLIYTGYIDFDMVNAHPTMISQLCNAFSIPCTKLQDYVDNREHHLKTLMEVITLEDAKKARDLAKHCFIRVMFGGSPSTWLYDNETNLKPGATLPVFVSELSAEIRTISQAIQAENTELVTVVKEKRANDGKTTNFDGSFLSYYAQEWECRILEHVIVFATSKGYLGDNNSACLMYDGTQLLEENIKRQGVTADEVCRQFESIVYQKWGLRVGWAQKPMDQSLLGNELEAAEVDEFEFDETKTKQFDSTYMNGLNCYVLKKKYFELFACKVMTPEVSYIFEQTIPDETTEKTECTTAQYSIHQIRDMVMHCPSGEVDGRNQPIPFTKLWLCDPNIRVYNRVVNEPYADVYNPVRSASNNTYNLFKGYDSRTQTPYPKAWDRSTEDGKKTYLAARVTYLKPFFDLAKELCEGNEDRRDFILRNFAIKYQYPGRKHPFIIVFIGPQGTGKSLFLDAIGRLFGEEHYYATDNPDDLFGKHAEGFVGKLLTQLAECEGRDMRQYQGKMKARSTDVYLTCNAKCRRPIRVKNFALIVVVSNKPDPIQIDVTSGDRRFIVMKGTDAYLENRREGRKAKTDSFWKRLAAHLKLPLFMRLLSDYFNEMELDDIDFNRQRKQHLTPAYYAMAQQSVPIEATFLDDIMDKLKIKVQEEAGTHQVMLQRRPYRMYDFCMDLGLYEGGEKTLLNFKMGYDGTAFFVQVERRKVFEQFKLWTKFMNFKHCPAAKRFYSRLKELEIPGFEDTFKSNGFASNRFRPDDILSHLIAKRWSESGPLPQEEESLIPEDEDDDLSQFDMPAYGPVSDDSVDSADDGEEGTANERPSKRQRTQ
jgi:hypothetical protein